MLQINKKSDYNIHDGNCFAVVRAYGSYKPFEGSIVYGNFSAQGTRDLYNYTNRVVFTGTITDYWLSYQEAQDALDYYCPVYGKGTAAATPRVFKKEKNLKRVIKIN